MTHAPEIVDHVQTPTATVRGTMTMEGLRDFYDGAFGRVAAALERQEVTPTSAFGFYLSPPTGTFELEVGFVVDRAIKAVGDVLPSSLPGGRTARLTHLGPYDGLGSSWQRLMDWVVEQGLTPAGPLWEVYVTQPTPEGDPARMRTDLFCLVAQR